MTLNRIDIVYFVLIGILAVVYFSVLILMVVK